MTFARRRAQAIVPYPVKPGSEEKDFGALLEVYTKTAKVKERTLAPLLPALLSLQGQPYSLVDHFVMEPLFNTTVPWQVVYKCGRQVSKSTSLAAQGLVQSTTTPYFRSLYVLPLYEQARRFSSNVLRPFIAESPIRGHILDTSCEQSVLQKSFANKSTMYFTFAFLDCDRTRGISADKLAIDESVTPCLITTYDKTTGYINKWLTELTPGDTIVSFDQSNALVADKLIRVSNHGRRLCFRLTLENGHAIEATSESWFSTDRGWMRLSQIISEISSGVVQGCGTDQRLGAGRTECAAGAIGVGYDAGRRLDDVGETRILSQPARLATAPVQLDQVPDIVRVRSLDSAEGEEQGLRRLVESLPHHIPPGIRLLVSPLLPPTSQAGLAGLAERHRSGGHLGIDHVVGGRRWEPVLEQAHTITAHRGFLSSGGGTPTSLAAESPAREGEHHHVPRIYNGKHLPSAGPVCAGHRTADGEDHPVHAREHGVQDLAVREADRGGLLLVRPDLSAASLSEQTTDGRQTLLPVRGLSPSQAQGSERRSDGEARLSRTEERQTAGRVLEQSGSFQSTSQSEYQDLLSNTPRRGEREETCEARSSRPLAPATTLVVPTLQPDGAAGYEGLEAEVLPGLPCLGDTGEPITLQAIGITKIECIGEQDVYDLETEKHHTFLANGIAVHNCQDMDWDFIPIISETLSASKWGIRQFSGTPKTFDNTLEVLWNDSSQAEWFIPCGCNHWNIPSAGLDALDMLGPVSNIAKYGTALICSKCGKPINARAGQWIHRYPERRGQFAGYHVPQIIMPMHYASDKKWTELLTKKNKRAGAVLLNEVLGESCDVGTKLITLEELRKVCILHKLEMSIARAINFTGRYTQRILGVDWGGGGMEETSYTTISVVGLRPDGKQEVLWAERLHMAVSDMEEVKRILEVFHIFACHYIAHDFAGSGSVHETLLIQSGFPIHKIIPFSYVRTGGKALIVYHGPDTGSIRHYYSLDKTWSIMLICMMIKTGQLLLPDFESSKDLVEDFLHLQEDKTETVHHGDILTVKRKPKTSDDFVHSTNFAVCAHFHTTQRYPDFANQFGLSLSDDQRNFAHPPQTNVEF